MPLGSRLGYSEPPPDPSCGFPSVVDGGRCSAGVFYAPTAMLLHHGHGHLNYGRSSALPNQPPAQPFCGFDHGAAGGAGNPDSDLPRLAL